MRTSVPRPSHWSPGRRAITTVDSLATTFRTLPSIVGVPPTLRSGLPGGALARSLPGRSRPPRSPSCTAHVRSPGIVTRQRVSTAAPAAFGTPRLLCTGRHAPERRDGGCYPDTTFTDLPSLCRRCLRYRMSLGNHVRPSHRSDRTSPPLGRVLRPAPERCHRNLRVPPG